MDQYAIEYALNVSDLLTTANEELLDQLFSRACQESGAPGFHRLYMGSYFCDRFFLGIAPAFLAAANAFCQKHGLGLTLVVPLCSQGLLNAVKTRVEEAAAQCSELSEITVNDPAMARFATGLPQVAVCAGRLLARSQRDPRYEELDSALQPYALDAAAVGALSQYAGTPLAWVEADPFAPHIGTEALAGAAKLALHLPHSLMTTGHICAAASQGLPVAQRYRADGTCRMQCKNAVTVHEAPMEDRTVYFTRHGRSVYFENPNCEVQGQQPQRIIWTPADFLHSEPEPAPAAESWPADSGWPTPGEQPASGTEGGSAWDAY